MFGQVNPTPFDLRFSLFGIPVYVHPLFWVIAAAIMWERERLDMVVVRVLCVFVSILVHELGHALFQRRWGTGNYIQLHFCGGVAVFIPDAGYTYKRAIIVALAGPCAGFLLAGLMIALLVGMVFLPPEMSELLRESKIFPYLDEMVSTLIGINIFWSIMNLMPVLPLDGGHVTMNLCQIFMRYRGQALGYKIGMISALIIVVFIAQLGVIYLTLMFAYFGFQNWQAYNHLTGRNF